MAICRLLRKRSKKKRDRQERIDNQRWGRQGMNERTNAARTLGLIASIGGGFFLGIAEELQISTQVLISALAAHPITSAIVKMADVNENWTGANVAQRAGIGALYGTVKAGLAAGSYALGRYLINKINGK